MRVFVVMGNDYPDAVFATEHLAEAYCDEKRARDRREYPERRTPRIYWRVYGFDVQEAAE